MPQRAKLEPGPEHPITIGPHPKRVVVSVGGRTIADTARALSLAEARYPVAIYIPREDVDMSCLTRSRTHTYCPYKGEASYFSIPAGGDRSTDAVWTYEAPYPSVDRIKDYLSFYSDRVDSIAQTDA